MAALLKNRQQQHSRGIHGRFFFPSFDINGFKKFLFLFVIFLKRRREISQTKMLNRNIKNKSYYMKFKHKNMSYMPL